MNIKMLLSASILAMCSMANAQTVVEITDPARIAEIERHAQQLGAQPTSAPAGTERMGHGERMHHGERMDREHMRKHGHGMRHHKRMHGQRATMKPAPEMTAPPASN